MWGKKNSHPVLVGVHTCTATMKVSLEDPWEDFKRSTPRFNYTIHGHMQTIIPTTEILAHPHSLKPAIGNSLDAYQV